MVTTTPEGLLFLLVGNLLGAAILFVTFSLTVMAVPCCSTGTSISSPP